HQSAAPQRTATQAHTGEPAGAALPVTLAPSAAPAGVLGRDAALAQMRGWLAQSLRSERQGAFITGEPGVGETTFVETFLDQASASRVLLVARGRCFEQYGAGEPSLPVLDALSRLCREPGNARVIDTLRKHAPTWLAQMPWIIAAAGSDDLQQLAPGVTRER